MTIVEFPTAKTAASRAAKRAAASRPRNSKNGTPEERAAKAGAIPADRVPIPRRSKYGTPEERAAKRASATVIDVTSQLTRRAAATRATKGEPMTMEEFAARYDAYPRRQAMVDAMIEKMIQSRPTARPALVLAFDKKPA